MLLDVGLIQAVFYPANRKIQFFFEALVFEEKWHIFFVLFLYRPWGKVIAGLQYNRQ